MNRLLLPLAVLLAAGMHSPVLAQDQAPLPELSLEELMAVKVLPVFGASERLQPVTEAPASVTIITADDIRRHQYRTLADILRAVRGFVISDDRNYTYVGIRGFSQPGDFNTRVLLLVNGHKINDNIYDQGFIGSELNIDVAMFERVEVIRGPASSLYGTSAFFAVINIITRDGRSIDGIWADADAGTLGTVMGRAAFGRVFANGLDLALSARHERTDGVERLYFASFDAPETNNGIAEGLDGEEFSTAYGQLKWGGFAVTATAGTRLKYVPTASYGTVFNHQDPPLQTTDARVMLHASYEKTVGVTRVAVNAAYDRYRYEGIYVYPGEDYEVDSPFIRNDDGANGTRFSGGGTITRPLPGRQTLTAGAELIANIRQRQWGTYSDPSVEGFDIENDSIQSALYVQDEIRVLPWLLLNAGLRHDRYERFARTTPRGGIIVLPSPNQSFKYLYGEAFRAPNEYELWYYEDASARLRPETLRTHELAWEQYFGERLRTSVSLYHTTAHRLIALTADDDAEWGLRFVNEGRIRARGIEFEAEARSGRGLQANVSASFQRSEDDTGARPPNWPGFIAEGRLSAPGPWTGSLAGLEVHHIGERPTLQGLVVDPYTLAHASFTTPLSGRLSLVASVRNIFDTQYFDPASAEITSDSIEQSGRTARVGLRLRLGGR